MIPLCAEWFFSKRAHLELHSNVIKELKNNLLGMEYKIINFSA